MRGMERMSMGKVILWAKNHAKCPNCADKVRRLFFSKDNSMNYGQVGDLIDVEGSLSLLSIITIAIEIAFYVYFHWI